MGMGLGHTDYHDVIECALPGSPHRSSRAPDRLRQPLDGRRNRRDRHKKVEPLIFFKKWANPGFFFFYFCSFLISI